MRSLQEFEETDPTPEQRQKRSSITMMCSFRNVDTRNDIPESRHFLMRIRHDLHAHFYDVFGYLGHARSLRTFTTFIPSSSNDLNWYQLGSGTSSSKACYLQFR